ncbi:hypothetical protein M0R45_001657 [Rubus argutus]|uniref:Uncharacterized protein n=1 Tax=Rubus argutus TaxID=59490 RepID=A0AAW1VL86_RUBAR
MVSAKMCWSSMVVVVKGTKAGRGAAGLRTAGSEGDGVTVYGGGDRSRLGSVRSMGSVIESLARGGGKLSGKAALAIRAWVLD